MKIGVDDLTVVLGDDAVLQDVTTTIEPGEFVGLVGPNGAGKTTLLRSILGATTPETGTVSLDGDPVDALSARERSRRVAAVPQRTAIAFEFTVREVVEMGRYPHTPRLGRDPTPDHVDAAMARTNVAHLADRSIDAVSGGERQRVLLARALAQDAPGLLLDEPTASLDINHQIRTLSLVADLAADGHTVLAAIHDLNLAARYCDRLLLMADGELTARGSPPAVLTGDAVQSAFDTRAVVRSDPLTGSPVVTAFPDQPTDREATVHVVGGGESAAHAISTLDEAGYTVTTGIIPTGDTVETTATARDIPAVTAPPFDQPDTQIRSAAKNLVDAAAVTVVVPGETTRTAANRRVIETADRIVVVGDDGSGPPGARYTDRDHLVPTVTAALTDPPRTTTLPATD